LERKARFFGVPAQPERQKMRPYLLNLELPTLTNVALTPRAGFATLTNRKLRDAHYRMEVDMKVIAFNGSPHETGTTARGIAEIAGELEKAGITVERVHVGDKPVRGCIGCGSCFKTGRCQFDDIVNESADKLTDADGLIIGSPVYYGGIAGGFKCFLDRLFFTRPNLRLKVGAAVVALRRSGGINAYYQLLNYLNLAQVIVTPTQYWDVIHGANAAETEQDKEGMAILRTAGKNMAWLLKTIAAGKGVPLPEAEERAMTNFIR
jgi:multimeric flavodoxin WrbA